MSTAPLIVSIIGRPNVGKSSLFNRLTGGRNKSLTYDYPGVTRDRHYGTVDLESDGLDREIVLVDTGGFYPNPSEGEGHFFDEMKLHAEAAVEESDLVLLVVDCRDGLLPLDDRIAGVIRKFGKPFWVVVNKFDSYATQEGDEVQFYRLGIDEADMFVVSAAHGLGVGNLKEAMIQKVFDVVSSARLQQGILPKGEIGWTVAVVGMPNSGKSTLFNRMVGAERALVSPVSGTTVDPVDGYFDMDFAGESVVFVRLTDTAGIAKKNIVGTYLEEQSIYRSLSCIARSNAVVYLVDATKGIGHQDKRLLGLSLERGKSLIICLNKMDLVEKGFTSPQQKEEWLHRLEDSIAWANFCRLIPICAQSGRGFRKLKEELKKTFLSRSRTVPTGQLNKFIAGQVERNPVVLKGSGGGKLKIKYASMVKSDPPTILLFSNRSKGIPKHYKKYLVKGLRQKFDFENTPIHLVFRSD